MTMTAYWHWAEFYDCNDADGRTLGTAYWLRKSEEYAFVVWMESADGELRTTTNSGNFTDIRLYIAARYTGDEMNIMVRRYCDGELDD